jgi:hypothetical protein
VGGGRLAKKGHREAGEGAVSVLDLEKEGRKQDAIKDRGKYSSGILKFLPDALKFVYTLLA